MNRYSLILLVHGCAITILLLENILPFIPSEIIHLCRLMSVKSLIHSCTFATSTIASLIGLLVLYYISRLVSEERLYRFVDKYGKWIKLKGKDAARATIGLKNMAQLLFYLSLYTCSCVLITIPVVLIAEVMLFAILSLIGTTIWNFVLIYLGKMLSGSWDMLMNGLHTYSYIMYVIIILAVIFIVYRLFKKIALNK